MKHINPIPLTIVLSLFSLSAFCQADNWQAIETNGFGVPGMPGVVEFAEYNDTLFAGFARVGPGDTQLWRSGTGDAGDWDEVTNFTPPLMDVKSIHSFGSTTLDGGHMWFATGAVNKGGQVYHSTDGWNWDAISLDGMGDTAASASAPHMVVFQGTGDTIPYLYAGVGSHGGSASGSVWRTPYTNTNPNLWDSIINMSFNPNITIITYFYVWGDTIYFSTDGGAQLWQSQDGINFTKNAAVGNGFGDPTNQVLSSLEVFNGELFATTTNMSPNGGQMWKTPDGWNWTQVTGNAFGKQDTVNELRSLRASFGKLWATAYTVDSLSNGSPIWRTDDGNTWIRSNKDGFGIPDNDGENAVTIGFKNHQYFGGPNPVAGAQIWRADMTTGVFEAIKIDCSASLYPNPISGVGYIDLSGSCAAMRSVEVYDLFGKRVAVIPASNGRAQLDRDVLTPGIYFYSVPGEHNTPAGKFIVQ